MTHADFCPYCDFPDEWAENEVTPEQWIGWAKDLASEPLSDMEAIWQAHGMQHALRDGVKIVSAQAAEIERLRTLEARFLCDEGKVCGACGGIGFRSYGSTSAWRGGAGGQTMTEGICDRCWGTGNEGKPGPNLRRIEARIARLERERETLAEAVESLRRAEGGGQAHTTTYRQIDEDCDGWECTADDCDMAWSLTDGGTPSEHSMRYCPGCGRRIVSEKPWQEDEDAALADLDREEGRE